MFLFLVCIRQFGNKQSACNKPIETRRDSKSFASFIIQQDKSNDAIISNELKILSISAMQAKKRYLSKDLDETALIIWIYTVYYSVFVVLIGIAVYGSTVVKIQC